MITKAITKNLKELKINGENIDFSEASVRLIENTVKVPVNVTESTNVIEWGWGMAVKVHYQSNLNPGQTFDVRMVTKNDELFEGNAILNSVAIENSSDIHVEEIFFNGTGTLEGLNNENIK
ncbi:hypothetical protein ACS2BO_27295 [Bacillus cereus group sp. BceL305]|uniref:hypothetical protein n=1 Tax=Bacillus cereus group sp. BceL305 TaxID=3444980 RepID=UPI003F259EF3